MILVERQRALSAEALAAPARIAYKRTRALQTRPSQTESMRQYKGSVTVCGATGGMKTRTSIPAPNILTSPVRLEFELNVEFELEFQFMFRF